VIFVSVGTNEAPFDRLVQGIARVDVAEQIVIQHGHSAAADVSHAELFDFLPFETMVDTIRRARVVVTHAGVGTVLVCLANGKHPVVVPRLASFGEAVDDHQVQLGRRFAEAGLVTLVESLEELGAVLDRKHDSTPITPVASALCSDLSRFLESAVAQPLALASR
jgi:UDP-N-acetylglucosamine transferase subunit ALG13